MNGARIIACFLILGFLLTQGCTHYKEIRDSPGPTLFIPEAVNASQVVRYAPALLVHNPDQEYNRIASPTAKADLNGNVHISMETGQPRIYVETAPFETDSGRYTNFVYRVHFPATPFSLIPFFIGAGSNMGLLVVLTVNDADEPVLVTTVGTCGCYVSVIPTDRLAAKAFPTNWKDSPVKVYGESLPSLLRVGSGSRLMVEIRPGEHRVMGLEMIEPNRLDGISTVPMRLSAAEDLERIPVRRLDGKNEEVSLYYHSWPLAGHVRGAWKPWETLLLGALSMDPVVGMDKQLGNPANPFYTSLKPWNRNASDMNDFTRFLRHYGWRL